jgi:uncharacterized protein YecE (DUF72 family)
MDVWVGTSGYSYSDWVGELYPRGTASKRMLAYYARSFPLTELNFTFYRPPTATILARQARQTPRGFQFAVKLFRGFTHDSDLTGAVAFRGAVDVLRQEGRLCALLAQFPQQFHDGAKDRAFVEALHSAFADYPLAVEFRHRSWARPEVTEWLRARELFLVSVDVPPLASLFPTGLVRTGRFLYIRLHSRNAQAWYAGDKERYDYLYSEAELREWVTWLEAEASQADRAIVLFNNCYRGQAAHNARRFQEFLRALHRPDLRLVEPPPAMTAEGDQRLLF